jgi:predicted nucleic acid-binding protein
LADTHLVGLLDTCVIIDLARYGSATLLPQNSRVSAVSLAELSYGVALAPTPTVAAARSQVLAALRTWLTPLPFDWQAADKYGELAALVLAAGRQPRPRRFDLMIAATAIVHDLPLYTANADDFRGLEPLLDICPVTPSS